jgi:signal transduction histidine kinase
VDPAVRLGVAAFSYGSDGQGVLALLRDDGRSFTPSELRLLQAIGQQLGLAVRNATLYHAEQEKVRRLEELDQARHQFVATISHELRTPLTAIKGYVTLVLAGRVGGLNPRQEEFLRIADRQLDHLTRLINDLLDLSRMRAGQLRLSKEPLALASVAAEVVESYRQLAAERGVTLESAVSLTLPTVWYDRQRLVQVLTNLVGNALKFTPAGGAVRIEAAVRGREVVVAVQDTGIGIPSAAQGRLFEGFYQVEPGRAGGTGLGLYIARQLVTAHGGRIWVESEPGCGATFSFSIPLSAAEVEPAAA